MRGMIGRARSAVCRRPNIAEEPYHHVGRRWPCAQPSQEFHGEQLQPLSDRANRMFIRNLKAIKELRQGLVPAIAIGRAEHVTVTNRQKGRARRTKAMLVEKGLEVVDDRHERSGSQVAPIGRVPQPLGH